MHPTSPPFMVEFLMHSQPLPSIKIVSHKYLENQFVLAQQIIEQIDISVSVTTPRLHLLKY